MKEVLFILVFFIVTGCSNKYSKNDHFSTFVIENGLYREMFCITNGGVFANDTYSYYITDSVNFRKYIGTVYYDDERIHCEKISVDTILVYTERSKSPVNEADTFDISYYSISQLKKEGEFD